ncbi:TetR/AcrR family transcriptional regulator [Streptomonospora sp. S1-112]|uniref:TetR/AcrR family transcriptional regulator n=1 Tax=Streptomonospora mangrovi TaxID=2883123 RepID=A0A9X3NIL6_9ACTN|nr:TetR/AcrR family transcriptional regulator [Streptomonospora mangrovi]MDA0564107.1 TetR/AcrR family transcriptional regulator [Streptomonospora mangrovi]
MSTQPRRTKAEQSAATRRRLLDAAFEEFHRHGLAGGRVDRIAERAGANKRLIYIYFGDKDGLFDAVVARDLAALLDAVPLTPHDLPGYAAALFDHLHERPALLRLLAWRNLERTAAGPAEEESYARAVARIAAAAGDDGAGGAFAPADVLAFVLALLQAWTSASPALRRLAGTDGDPAVRERRRRALREAVARLTAPG